jgi:hypothetical protein
MKNPVAVVEINPAKGDVGELAKAAAGAETPHRAKGAPSATLVLNAPRVKATDGKKVKEVLKNVKGVDANASAVRGKTIQVKLSDEGGAKLADIKKALASYIKA